VAVVSDSTAYLPPHFAVANGVHVVQQYVHFGDGRVEHEDDTDLDAFFEEMRSIEELPTTSPPTADDFETAYRPLLDAGREIVSVHISEALSHTCDEARDAAKRLGASDMVTVIDSCFTAGGLGLIALAAARRASAGADAQHVVSTVEEARTDLKLWFSLDTLEFLKRGGRIGAVSAWIGSTMGVKPILTIEDGQIAPVERVRSSERALERMVDYARQRHASGADAWTVQHVQSAEEAEVLVERCREVYGTEPVYVSEIGAVVGAHSGAGLLMAAIPPRLLA
jgi:DegV family protein with EDD domain